MNFMRVARALYAAAYDISEMGCTCGDSYRTEHEGHQRDCVGEKKAREHLRKAGLPIHGRAVDLAAIADPTDAEGKGHG